MIRAEWLPAGSTVVHLQAALIRRGCSHKVLCCIANVAQNAPLSKKIFYLKYNIDFQALIRKCLVNIFDTIGNTKRMFLPTHNIEVN